MLVSHFVRKTQMLIYNSIIALSTQISLHSVNKLVIIPYSLDLVSVWMHFHPNSVSFIVPPETYMDTPLIVVIYPISVFQIVLVLALVSGSIRPCRNTFTISKIIRPFARIRSPIIKSMHSIP